MQCVFQMSAVGRSPGGKHVLKISIIEQYLGLRGRLEHCPRGDVIKMRAALPIEALPSGSHTPKLSHPLRVVSQERSSGRRLVPRAEVEELIHLAKDEKPHSS
jgi:hypothetical protein